MYQTGAGYTERRALLSQNLTSRLYDSVSGIRINVIQVLFRASISSLLRQRLLQHLNAAMYEGKFSVDLTSCKQTGTILIPDFVTAVLNLMTGMGLLGVAAMVRQLPFVF
jgi:hypothetical protein